MKVNLICLKIFMQKSISGIRIFNPKPFWCFFFFFLFFSFFLFSHDEKLKHMESNSITGGEILSSVNQMFLIRKLSFPFSPLACCRARGSATQLAKFSIIHTEEQDLGLICYSSPIQALLQCRGKSQGFFFIWCPMERLRLISTKQTQPFHYHSWTFELCHGPILIVL